jgi:hypothetical protein
MLGKLNFIAAAPRQLLLLTQFLSILCSLIGTLTAGLSDGESTTPEKLDKKRTSSSSEDK